MTLRRRKKREICRNILEKIELIVDVEVIFLLSLSLLIA